MKHEDFVSLIGQDVVVDYPFFQEIQRWSMKNFFVDADGTIRHNRRAGAAAKLCYIVD